MGDKSTAIAKVAEKKPARNPAKRNRGLKLDKKTFLQWFVPSRLYPEEQTADYFEIGPIIAKFNQATGSNKRSDHYRNSSRTQKELEKWTQLISVFSGISLLSSGAKSEGIHGKTSPKLHRVMMPHFLEWLGKGYDVNLSVWWQLYGHLAIYAPIPPRPPKPKLEDWEAMKRCQSAEVRKRYQDILNNWFKAHPGESTAPNIGIFIKTRDGQITKGLWNLTIAGVQKALGIYLTKEVGSKKRQKINIRDYLQVQNLDQLMETKKFVVVLVRAGHSPKDAAPVAATSVREINPLPLLTGNESPALTATALPC